MKLSKDNLVKEKSVIATQINRSQFMIIVSTRGASGRSRHWCGDYDYTKSPLSVPGNKESNITASSPLDCAKTIEILQGYNLQQWAHTIRGDEEELHWIDVV